VLYEIHLKNLVKNETYISDFRFKELKEYHENLQKLNVVTLIIVFSWNFHPFLKLISGKKLTKIQK
jgi:hypothetical protein